MAAATVWVVRSAPVSASHDERLAQGDDDEQPVPLAEVVGADVPALGGSGRHGGDHIEQHRGRPPPRSGVTPDHAAAGHGGQAARGQQGEAAHGRPLGHVVPGHPAVEGKPDDADRNIGRGEPATGILEGIRDGHRHQEGDGGGGQHDGLHGGMGRVGGVQRPGELGPGRPHQPEDDHRMRDPGPGQLLVHQADRLGHGVDEHQVEEELDERRALVLGGGDRPP
jgi:hypothetical protein